MKHMITLLLSFLLCAPAIAKPDKGKKVDRRIAKTQRKAQRGMRRKLKNASPEDKAKMREARQTKRRAFKNMSKEERKAARTAQKQARKANAKRRRLEANQQARALSGEKKPPKALKQEFRRHARRQARLDKIRALAEESGDEKIMTRVGKLREKEDGRHQKWISKFKSKKNADVVEKEAE